ELDFSLQEIKRIIKDPNFTAMEALEEHRRTLVGKQARLTQLIQTIDQTILDEKGAITMTNEDRFKGFDFTKNEYEQEARGKWGNEAVDNMNKKVIDNTSMQNKMNERFRELANIRHVEPSSDEARVEMDSWFKDLKQMGHYSFAAFRGLGEMYVEDERCK